MPECCEVRRGVSGLMRWAPAGLGGGGGAGGEGRGGGGSLSPVTSLSIKGRISLPASIGLNSLQHCPESISREKKKKKNNQIRIRNSY